MKKELMEGLTPEQIEKARKCKNQEELLALAKAEGVELTPEQLEACSGGFCTKTNCVSCPRCGKKHCIDVKTDPGGHDCHCNNCGYDWSEGFGIGIDYDGHDN